MSVHYLLASVLLCWLQVLAASLIHARAWTPQGLLVAFGNREALPEPSPLAGRAKRAANNMLENLLLFVAVWCAANATGADPTLANLGQAVFFGSRVAHGALYLAGIPYLRTAAWAGGVAGICLLAAAALGVSG